VSPRILVVDNFDSFVHNLVHYLSELGADCELRRNDDPRPLAETDAAAVLISPGPGRPEQAGASVAIVRECASRGVPLLGVCLGHQAVAVAFGGTIGPGPRLLHGSTSDVHHKGEGILAGLPTPFAAARYHSLTVTSVPPELAVTARSEDGEVLALRHRALPIEGVQFHPEAVLTEHGHQLLANWLTRCGVPGTAEYAAQLDAKHAATRATAGFQD
jgi:para-aminobenzoate synthetase component 2